MARATVRLAQKSNPRKAAFAVTAFGKTKKAALGLARRAAGYLMRGEPSQANPRPKRKRRNVAEGFYDAQGRFHPIRAYQSRRAGEPSPYRHMRKTKRKNNRAKPKTKKAWSAWARKMQRARARARGR